MGSVISFYEQLVGTEDDRERMRLIAEALERLEHRPLPETVATGAQLRETELRLQKEIEQVRHETELVRAELKQDIEQVRAELKQDIAELRTETEKIRAELKQDIEQVRAEVARSKAETVKWMAGLLALQATAIVAALAGIMAAML